MYRLQTERCWSRSVDPAGANRAQSSHHRFSDKHFPTHKRGWSDRKQITTKHDSTQGRISHYCVSPWTYYSVNWQKKSCTMSTATYFCCCKKSCIPLNQRSIVSVLLSITKFSSCVHFCELVQCQNVGNHSSSAIPSILTVVHQVHHPLAGSIYHPLFL